MKRIIRNQTPNKETKQLPPFQLAFRHLLYRIRGDQGDKMGFVILHTLKVNGKQIGFPVNENIAGFPVYFSGN